MLYTKQQLENLSREEKLIASNRYFLKVQQGEAKRLLPHECEFVTGMLPYIYNEKSQKTPIYDIYALDFCAESLFKILLLRYLNNLDFLMPVFNGRRNLEAEEIARDKEKFLQLLEKWNQKLTADSGSFLHEIKIEYRRKVKILEKVYATGMFGGRNLYEREILKQKLCSFYIYLVTKSFFKSERKNFLTFQAMNNIFSVNIYSYVHIASRHYIPELNSFDAERSFNRKLDCIDPFNLPHGVKNIIIDYLSKAPETYTLNPEYMIFGQDQDFYILWWKYKRLSELNHRPGYEIRTLYRICAQRDINKIDHTKAVQINERLRYYY